MTKFNSFNRVELVGRIACAPEIRMARQADGGYVTLTINVKQEQWDATKKGFVPTMTQVPLTYYSKDPQKDVAGFKQGYCILADGHLTGRTFTSNGEQKLVADIRIDNVDVIEPMLRKAASVTDEPSKPSLQAGYREQAEIAKNESGVSSDLEQFDDDPIPF